MVHKSDVLEGAMNREALPSGYLAQCIGKKHGDFSKILDTFFADREME